MKIKVRQAQNNGLIFKRAQVYKRVVRRSAHPEDE